MKRAAFLLILIFAVVIAALAFSLDQKSISRLTYAQSAYPPPESYVVLPEVIPYPAPGDITTVLTPLPAEKVLTVSTSIDIIVEGLEGNDTVEIRIVPDSEKTASDVQTAGITLPVISLHNEFQRISLTAIPVGSYQLTIFAPASYFREPQGYCFQVQESGIVN